MLTDEYIENIRKEMVELPDAKKARFIKEMGLTPYDADVLCENKEVAAFFEKAAKGSDGKKVANWIMGDFFAMLKARHLELEQSPVKPEYIGKLVNLINSGVISGNIGKEVFLLMADTGEEPEKSLKKKGLSRLPTRGPLKPLSTR